eukprot:CAMPEP_0172835732 /NCGR_PEP_ID=MMETSP1075-20121228/25988_1 /TAXON_ID=2916 /ORGANISM="Ceratium fusus, Strain PA161109" /LENGTH=68 /DNA_ID=CAMNT_0013678845 /DNA_START=214 /DNA_END=420 /DNA_ORIENTATION=-
MWLFDDYLALQQGCVTGRATVCGSKKVLTGSIDQHSCFLVLSRGENRNSFILEHHLLGGVGTTEYVAD